MLIFLFQNILEANVKVLGPNYIFLVAIQIQYKGRFYKEWKPALTFHKILPPGNLNFFFIKRVTSPLKEINTAGG